MAGQVLRTTEHPATGSADIACSLSMLNLMAQQVHALLEGSATLASVEAWPTVLVAVAHTQ